MQVFSCTGSNGGADIIQALLIVCFCFFFQKKGKRKVQGVPQPQTAATPPRPQEEEETETLGVCFEQKYEKNHASLFKNFHFLVIKFSVYLDRRVFVMNDRISPSTDCVTINEYVLT